MSTPTFALLFVQISVIFANQGHYWDNYSGTVPRNAVEGGKDANGKTFYIGQAGARGSLLVAPIYPEVPYLEIPYNMEILKVNSSIKILCTVQTIDSGYWKEATSKNLHVVLIGREAVIGGNFENEGLIHVGRISYNNEIKIGPVLSFNLNKAYLAIVHNNKILLTGVYEVLLF